MSVGRGHLRPLAAPASRRAVGHGHREPGLRRGPGKRLRHREPERLFGRFRHSPRRHRPLLLPFAARAHDPGPARPRGTRFGGRYCTRTRGHSTPDRRGPARHSSRDDQGLLQALPVHLSVERRDPLRPPARAPGLRHPARCLVAGRGPTPAGRMGRGLAGGGRGGRRSAVDPDPPRLGPRPRPYRHVRSAASGCRERSTPGRRRGRLAGPRRCRPDARADSRGRRSPALQGAGREASADPRRPPEARAVLRRRRPRKSSTRRRCSRWT